MMEAVVTGLLALLGALLGTYFANWRFLLESKYKFALAAIDKKLDVHQKAFSLSNEMRINLSADTERRSEITKEADKFFYENCLFLSDKARKPFIDAVRDFSTYGQGLSVMKYEKDEANIQRAQNELKRVQRDFLELLDIIGKSVDFTNVSNVMKSREKHG